MEDYKALWRSSAYDAVPYTGDFPEAVLVLPELTDGAIGQGNATRVVIRVVLSALGKSALSVTDNGGGIRNERRLLQWAATRATSNIHRNGHGVKKCLAKWAPDYETASWSIRWRIANRNLQSTFSPFRGYAPDVVIDDEGLDATSLAPSGCEVSVEFDAGATLRHLHKPAELCAALKELIQSRYDERTLARTEFVVLVSDGGASIRMSSREEAWRSFKACVVAETGATTKIHEARHAIDGGHYTVEVYYTAVRGGLALKAEFPRYGARSMRSSRVHISLDGRVIEAAPIYRLVGTDANHNRYNGYKAFVNFVPDTEHDFAKLPVPCTTKVSMYENDAAYRTFVAQFAREFALAEQKVAPRARDVGHESQGSSVRGLYDAIIALKAKMDARSVEELVAMRDAARDDPVAGMALRIRALSSIATLVS